LKGDHAAMLAAASPKAEAGDLQRQGKIDAGYAACAAASSTVGIDR
jgi:hypothetical protein